MPKPNNKTRNPNSQTEQEEEQDFQSQLQKARDMAEGKVVEDDEVPRPQKPACGV